MIDKITEANNPNKNPILNRRQVLIGLISIAAVSGCSRRQPNESIGQDLHFDTPGNDPDCSIETGELDTLKSWQIDFSTFKDGPLDSGQWNLENGTEVASYNQEEQVYTDRQKNVRIEDGTLVIEAHHETYGGREFSSARINTLGIHNFTYGKIEFEAQLPQGAGTWPAAWLMPDNPLYDPDDFDIAPDDKWRWAMNGEIDILEAIGIIENTNIPAAHSIGQLRKGTIYTPAKIDDAYGKFHKYGLIKTPGKLVFTLDGEPYAERVKGEGDTPLEWPYDQSYYVIINLAMGGPWAGSEKAKYPPHGIDTKNHDSWRLKIRSITCETTD